MAVFRATNSTEGLLEVICDQLELERLKDELDSPRESKDEVQKKSLRDRIEKLRLKIIHSRADLGLDDTR